MNLFYMQENKPDALKDIVADNSYWISTDSENIPSLIKYDAFKLIQSGIIPAWSDTAESIDVLPGDVIVNCNVTPCIYSRYGGGGKYETSYTIHGMISVELEHVYAELANLHINKLGNEDVTEDIQKIIDGMGIVTNDEVEKLIEDKINESGNAVTSINSKTGAVVLTASDINLSSGESIEQKLSSIAFPVVQEPDMFVYDGANNIFLLSKQPHVVFEVLGLNNSNMVYFESSEISIDKTNRIVTINSENLVKDMRIKIMYTAI